MCNNKRLPFSNNYFIYKLLQISKYPIHFFLKINKIIYFLNIIKNV